VARDLDDLASLYYDQGKFTPAAQAYQRALAIYEKRLGPNDAQLATSLENYAATLRALDRNTEAEKLEARAKQVRAAAGPPAKKRQ